MTLNELFTAKPPTNKIVWRKRNDGVVKSYETEPQINNRRKIVTKDKDGK